MVTGPQVPQHRWPSTAGARGGLAGGLTAEASRPPCRLATRLHAGPPSPLPSPGRANAVSRRPPRGPMPSGRTARKRPQPPSVARSSNGPRSSLCLPSSPSHGAHAHRVHGTHRCQVQRQLQGSDDYPTMATCCSAGPTHYSGRSRRSTQSTTATSWGKPTWPPAQPGPLPRIGSVPPASVTPPPHPRGPSALTGRPLASLRPSRRPPCLQRASDGIRSDGPILSTVRPRRVHHAAPLTRGTPAVRPP